MQEHLIILPLQELKKWMDDSKDGFVYFTFGSMVLIETFPRKILDVFYASLGKIAPVRVLMKVPKPKKLPPGLPKNIHTSPWLPQLKVLNHPNIRAFITHGGLMGTLEAITYGVPMIGIPLYVDQYNNIDAYVAKNIAVKLDVHKMTEEDMDAALNAILHDPKYM
ncbi:UDP-glucuronosyltransferase 2B4 [Ooceraea biroi]|uniref:UDP-glucuronosyltransferase n=1 Tax=Ooceraea biroi TaxID=2015173 RepID=A0A026W787_OOCBI|nr:UDP-glucuronosyltransferase 2B4 [Ooceraea biroi]